MGGNYGATFSTLPVLGRFEKILVTMVDSEPPQFGVTSGLKSVFERNLNAHREVAVFEPLGNSYVAKAHLVEPDSVLPQ